MESVETCTRQAPLLLNVQLNSVNQRVHSRFTDGQVIKITLEGADKTFFVQKALLCSASSYFATALSGSFKEAAENQLRLPGCDQETLEFFLYWLCHQRLPAQLVSITDADKSDYASKRAKAQAPLVRLWCFADMILMPALQDDAMLRLIDCFHESRVHAHAVAASVELATSDSLIHKAIMDELARDMVADNESDEQIFTEENKNEMGAIPGVMSGLLDRLIARSDIIHLGTTERNRSKYMVLREE